MMQPVRSFIATAGPAAVNVPFASEAGPKVAGVPAGTIISVAGAPGAGPARELGHYPVGTARFGTTIYVVDNFWHAVRALDLNTGVETVLAGNGARGGGGDGGPADQAQLAWPSGIAVDALGNVYIADTENNRIRMVDANPSPDGTRHISTIAGTINQPIVVGGIYQPFPPPGSGDGGPATSAQISPKGVVVDPQGNVFIADTFNHRIRIVDAELAADGTHHIHTYAGGGYDPTDPLGESTDIGDDGPATAAILLYPFGIALDAAGNLYIADTYHSRIRVVDGQASPDGSHRIWTLAGDGSEGFAGDNGPAAAARLNLPEAVSVAPNGDIYIADSGNQVIRRVGPGEPHIITTVSGLGFLDSEDVPAASAWIGYTEGVHVDSEGNVWIADSSGYRVLRIDGSEAPDGTKHIHTLAGNLTRGLSGDGGPAEGAQLDWPRGLAFDRAGDLYIADAANNRIRRVEADPTASGDYRITTFVGGDVGEYLNAPRDLAFDGADNLYVADMLNHRVVKIDAVTHQLTPIAGTGVSGYSGDNGPATSARLAIPRDVTLDAAGNIYIADASNDRIRMVEAALSPDGTHHIVTVAGNGLRGFSGDEGPAVQAALFAPGGVALDNTGNIYIADNGNGRIRVVDAQVSTDGFRHIHTLAGAGSNGLNADDIPAFAARIWSPSDVEVDAAGNVYINELTGPRVRVVDAKISADGTRHIRTVAGGGTGFEGDGGPATSAKLSSPQGIAFDPGGNLYIADTDNQRVRAVTARDWRGATISSPDAGSVMQSNTVMVTGAATPGARVRIREAGAILADAISDESGSWSEAVVFADGVHEISAVELIGPGLRARAATRSFTVSTDPPPVTLLRAASRKIHAAAGLYDVDLPLTGAAGVECRSGGANGEHTIVFTFAAPLTSVAAATVTSGTATVLGGAIGANDARIYIVELIGVANAQTITVTLNNVTDSGGKFSSVLAASAQMLIGDTTGDGVVNSADIAQVKSQSGQSLSNANFREDVTADGNLNSADIALVKSKSGTGLP